MFLAGIEPWKEVKISVSNLFGYPFLTSQKQPPNAFNPYSTRIGAQETFKASYNKFAKDLNFGILTNQQSWGFSYDNIQLSVIFRVQITTFCFLLESRDQQSQSTQGSPQLSLLRNTPFSWRIDQPELWENYQIQQEAQKLLSLDCKLANQREHVECHLSESKISNHFFGKVSFPAQHLHYRRSCIRAGKQGWIESRQATLQMVLSSFFYLLKFLLFTRNKNTKSQLLYRCNFIDMNEDIIRKLSQAPQNQEFLLRDPSPNAELTPHMLDKYTKFHQFQYFTLFKVLSRVHSLRTHNELKFLSDYARKNPILKELSQINGYEYSRGLLRSASLEQYQAGSIVEQKGSEVRKVYIILEGKLGTIKNLDQTDMIQEMSLRKTYEQLTQIARRQIKRFNKLARKLSSLADHFQRHSKLKEGWNLAQYLEYYERYETFGDKIRCFGQIHTHTTLALQNTLLLTINLKNVMYWLNHCFQSKLEVSFKLLRQLPCFACLSDEILEQVIGFLVVTKAGKGEIVYEQDTESDKIYFLQEGELKIQKTSKLFIQNPNSLYLDRRKLMNEREISNNQYLPYADLHLLYNYKPTFKNIQIGILTPFCIFGEEEIIESRPRETTVRCMALKTTYFSIQLKKLYQTLGANAKIFVKGVEDSVKQKIKYRQNAFATSIYLQNKKQLKYFFQGDSPQISKQKKIIKKINDKLTLQTVQMQQKLQPKEIEEEVNKSNVVKNGIKSQRNSSNQQLIPPSFNSFNFHKMLKTKLKRPSLKQSSSQGQQQTINPNYEDLREQIHRQRKIINNSHTWRLIKAKVNKEKELCHKIGSYKHKINFSSPLIDQKHFQKIESEMKRIQRDKKVRSFNLSTITKSKDGQTSRTRNNMKSLNINYSHR